jgi:hypothetical protein
MTFSKEGIMAARRAAVLAIVAIAAGASVPAQIPQLPAPGQAEPVLQEIVAMQAFEERVTRYVLQHRLLEATVPPLQPTRDVRQIDMAVQALALRIRLARADARPGDLITPEAGLVFRRRIAACLTAAEWAAVLGENAAEVEEEEEGVFAGPPVVLTVNMTWPEPVPFGFVPPQLLAVLPRLPDELQYRIVGNALVLWDHHANLIVDFLPEAFAALT